MRRLSFHRLAERELDDAIFYYNSAADGLGSDFLDDVEAALGRIVRNPRSGADLELGVRRVLLRRFPFAVLYRIKDSRIRVLAIMNLRRRPLYWVGRG